MLKIRLRRMGSRHRPFYRIVVSDSRRTPTASALEEIGHYDPRKDPVALNLDVARVDHWMSVGAKPSETVGKLIAKARAGVDETPAESAEDKAEETAAAAAAETAEAEAAEAESADAAESAEGEAKEAAAADAESDGEGDSEKAAEPAEATEDDEASK